MHKLMTISGLIAVSLISATAANATIAGPSFVPAPEASTNVSFAVLLAAGLVAAFLARKKKNVPSA